MGPSNPNDFSIFSNMNDSPLEFKVNKNNPSTSRSMDDKDDSSQSPPNDKRDRRRSDRRERERRDTDKNRDDSDSNMSNPQENISLQNGPSGIGPNMWMSMGYPMVGMNMIMDPNMMSMNNYGKLNKLFLI